MPLLILPGLQESLGNGALKAREECSQMGGEGNSPGSVRRPPPEEPPQAQRDAPDALAMQRMLPGSL